MATSSGRWTGTHLLVGFHLALALVAKHLLHQVEALCQAPDLGVLNEVGVWGASLHLTLVDPLHIAGVQWVEQQLQVIRKCWS